MKILITGSSGFLGASLCDFFVRHGNTVLGVDIVIPPLGKAYRQQQYDLQTYDVKKMFQQEIPDWVIHCAGNANVGLSITDPLMDLNSSYVLLHRILYSIKSLKIPPKLLFLSSAAVYGNPQRLPIHEEDYRAPVSPYGLHKAACEDLCQYFSLVEGVDCRVLRIFSAYGSGLRKQILWDLYNKLMTPGVVEMFGTGNETRDFIHVNDVVNAAHIVMNSGTSGIYNVANGLEVKISKIVELFVDAIQGDRSRIAFNGIVKSGDPLNWKADISKLSHIGYVQSVPLEDGISSYITWRRSVV